jgi:hypothetical protein
VADVAVFRNPLSGKGKEGGRGDARHPPGGVFVLTARTHYSAWSGKRIGHVDPLR